MSDEQKQKLKDYQKKYMSNMTDEQKQKYREADKQYRDNMSDEQKQKLKDYQKDYQKKYNAIKKLNEIINDNKIIDNDNDNDSDCISIIIKLKNTVPIKYNNSILKINKKVCSQVYLEECNFIND